MNKIVGMYNEAYVFTDVIEDTAINQIKELLSLEVFKDSKIRLMPDVHAGAGCTIGTTMTIKDYVIPNAVGVDIGCGMLLVNLGKVDINLEAFDKVCHTIPSGQNVWESKKEIFDLEELLSYRELKNTKRIAKSLGTLGGGNHFIELDKDDEDNIYLVIHTGSRNLGKQVAEFYQNIAYDLNLGKEEYYIKKDELIKEYKETGRKKEIQDALKELRRSTILKEPTLDKDQCYLYGKFLNDYLHDLRICQEFARRNRRVIADTILNLTGLKEISSFETIHNYIDLDQMILRKGAVSAKKGETLLIPLNMRDGSLICVGKGNPDWNYSAPHGAGRLYGRKVAKETFTLEEYEKSMEGIYSTTISKGTLDECPMAYKGMNDIVDNIKDTVEIVKRIKPIYNFKAE